MSVPFRDRLKWSFIEPSKIIVGNSVAHVKRSAMVRSGESRLSPASSVALFRKLLKKIMRSGIKKPPMRIG
jgi:hypothetical protein